MAFASGTLLVALVGASDWFNGKEISLAIFYLVPVSLVGWVVGQWRALITAVLGGFTWYAADLLSGATYSHPAIPIWNAVMRGLMFVVVALLLPSLRAALQDAQAAKRSAIAATEAKSNFLSNMSHEIRTPLNAMVGATDILNDTALSPEQRDYVGILRNECEHLRRLVNDILDLSKLEADRMQIEETEFELRELITKIFQTMKPTSSEKGLDIIQDIAPEVEDSRLGDPYRLRQVILNLVSNAIKFTESGRITVRVKSAKADQVQFDIIDTGIGIPVAEQHDLFGRFAQANTAVSRKFGGSGLGLSIVKALVERMQGHIWFTSEVGKGSTFAFELPLKINPGRARAVDRVPGEPLAARRAPGTKLRLLLVEDYAVNRRILTHFLERSVFTVETAENGRLGLERFKSARYDVVIMDMHMPEMDGWTAVREIRKWEAEHPESPSTPIIALTASALKEDEDRCREAGCTSFLGKPIYKKELFTEIGRVLNMDILSEPVPQFSAKPRPDVDPEIAALVPQFLEEMLQRLGSLIEAAESKDFETAKEIAHQIIGPGGSFGFPDISNLGRDLECAAAQNDQADLKRLAQEFTSYVKKVKVIYE